MVDQIHLKIIGQERIGGMHFLRGTNSRRDVLLLLNHTELQPVQKRNWMNGTLNLSSFLFAIA